LLIPTPAPGRARVDHDVARRADPVLDRALMDLVGDPVPDGEREGEADRHPQRHPRAQGAPPQGHQQRILGEVRDLAREDVPKPAFLGGAGHCREHEDEGHQQQRR
jgi:hypothetical protein